MYSNGREGKFTDTDGTRWVKCGGGKFPPDCFSFLTDTLVTKRFADKSQRRDDLAMDMHSAETGLKWHSIRAPFSPALFWFLLL